MGVIQALVLGFVQGLTEFLPVSSSGHLILVPHIFGWKDQGLSFDAMIHMGTAFAAIWFFRVDIKQLLTGIVSSDQQTDAAKNSFRWAILASMVPAVIVGLFLKDFIESSTRGTVFVAVNLIIWSFVLLAADWLASRPRKTAARPTVSQAIIIGVAQACALLPGTSRSGATIATGIFCGLDRASAVRFSFVAGIPIILAVGAVSSVELVREVLAGQLNLAPLFVGFAASFAGGILAIRILLAVLNKHGLSAFALYRLVLALIVLTVLR